MTHISSRHRAIAAVFPLLLAAGACSEDPLEMYGGLPDAGGGDDEDLLAPWDGWSVTRDGGGNGGDGCLAHAEVCDGKDNDCNGVVDDVDPSYLTSNAKNCGACGKVCAFPYAIAECAAGTCRIKECAPGYFDVKGGSGDGCEYRCVKSNDGQEECPLGQPDCACDGVDNDCDGQIDEVFDKSKDKNNCGACGKRCLFGHAATSCVGGQCVMGACDVGFKDLDGDPSNGCEYGCPVWPAATDDPCDGTDNDCDGDLDEDTVAVPCGIDTGECQPGHTVCFLGKGVCQGAIGPAAELCNGKDDNCDGTVDNGFDKQNDPRYCGASCTKCAMPHAIAKCTTGVCGIAVCENGFVDLNKQAIDGCEYPCAITGPEICDGKDNDCDGKIDTADADLIAPGSNPCLKVGACAGATASCQGALGWVCNYGSAVQLKKCVSPSDCGIVPCSGGACPGVVALEETLCDDVDNDCDGLTDEPFPSKGLFCAESGKQGVCQRTGSFVCTPDRLSAVCQLTSVAQPPGNEECDGKDNDCDGQVDEEQNDNGYLGVVDAMVHIARGGLDFWVYIYEASRPDAVPGGTAGSSGARACSKANVKPWANVTYAQAAAACTAAGKRLCTPAEWTAACAGSPARVYPYGDAYVGGTCNGQDAGASAALATGAKAQCTSSDGAKDMSGNLREWINDPIPAPPASPDAYTVRGGGFDTPQAGLRCDSTFVVMPPAFSFPNLGFRCCSNAAP